MCVWDLIFNFESLRIDFKVDSKSLPLVKAWTWRTFASCIQVQLEVITCYTCYMLPVTVLNHLTIPFNYFNHAHSYVYKRSYRSRYLLLHIDSSKPTYRSGLFWSSRCELERLKNRRKHKAHLTLHSKEDTFTSFKQAGISRDNESWDWHRNSCRRIRWKMMYVFVGSSRRWNSWWINGDHVAKSFLFLI